MNKTQSAAGYKMLVASIATALGFWVTHMLLRELAGLPPGHSTRLIVTCSLIAAFAWVVWAHVRLVRTLDELHRRVHLEALAVGYTTSICLLFAVGFLRGEGLLASRDPRDLASLMLVPYAAGLAIAWRRYK